MNETLSKLGMLDETTEHDRNKHREDLIGLSQSGLLQKIGIKKTESQLIEMKDAEIEKLYNEYQNKYTGCVSDDMVDNILYGYAAVCHCLAPATDKDKLAKELKDNFVISAEIKKQLGQWGIFLSPWLAVANVAVITTKNITLKSDDKSESSNFKSDSSNLLQELT